MSLGSLLLAGFLFISLLFKANGQSPYEYWTDLAVSSTGNYVYGVYWAGQEVGVLSSATSGDSWVRK